MRALRRTAALACLVTMSGLAGPFSLNAGAAAAGPRACPPSARAVGYSDALDKLTRGGATLGGLSDLAYDRRSHSYASTVDNHDTDPARIWFLRNPLQPRVTRAPLVLRRPDGTAYTGLDADDEGLAVLPGGRFLVSSETEPAIRVFGRDGVQRTRLRVPARFRVAPAGQATANATLEGLTVTPRGDRVVAAMEGTLSGDLAADGTDSWRRWLVYDRGRHGRFHLTKQVGYRVDPGMRIAEVQAYADGRALVLEAAFDPASGNTIKLYAVRGLGRARDVSRIPDLSTASARDVLRKRLVADVTACPTLGATSDEPQRNPLMDNYEGMSVGPVRHHRARVTLVSDDNFSDTQRTRLLTLSARLP
jgi:hypothetical protein